MGVEHVIQGDHGCSGAERRLGICRRSADDIHGSGRFPRRNRGRCGSEHRSQEPSATLGALTLSSSNTILFEDRYSSLIPGNDIAISGPESLTIGFSAPVTSFGIQVHEPSATGSSLPDTTNTVAYIDSTFQMTLKSGGAAVGSATFTPANDVLAFMGVLNGALFDSVEIVETVGGAENEYFGQVYTNTGATPVPLPAALPILAAALGGLVSLQRRH